MWDACDTLLWQWLSNRPFLLWGPRWSTVPLCSVMYWSTQTAFPNVLRRCSVCSNKPVPCVFMWRSLAHGSPNPNCCKDWFTRSCNDLVSCYQPELSKSSFQRGRNCFYRFSLQNLFVTFRKRLFQVVKQTQHLIYRINFDKDWFCVDQKQCVWCLNIKDSCKWIQIFKVQLVLTVIKECMNWGFGVIWEGSCCCTLPGHNVVDSLAVLLRRKRFRYKHVDYPCTNMQCSVFEHKADTELVSESKGGCVDESVPLVLLPHRPQAAQDEREDLSSQPHHMVWPRASSREMSWKPATVSTCPVWILGPEHLITK